MWLVVGWDWELEVWGMKILYKVRRVVRRRVAIRRARFSLKREEERSRVGRLQLRVVMFCVAL